MFWRCRVCGQMRLWGSTGTAFDNPAVDDPLLGCANCKLATRHQKCNKTETLTLWRDRQSTVWNVEPVAVSWPKPVLAMKFKYNEGLL